MWFIDHSCLKIKPYPPHTHTHSLSLSLHVSTFSSLTAYRRRWLHSKSSASLTHNAGCNIVNGGVRNGTNGYSTSSEHVEQPGVSIIKVPAIVYIVN